MDLSYGTFAAAVEGFARVVIAAAVGTMMALSGPAAAQSVNVKAAADTAKPVRLAVLGDSLTAGFGLSASDAFPAKLQKALRDKGITVDILNAGVSGDTASGGLARLDWSIPQDIEAVIVELGANDALRGVDPAVTRKALDGILTRLKARNVAVLLCGMYAPPNYGADYAARFNSIYPDLAKAHGVPLYPFFLDGVATVASLTQSDGLHPTAAGIDVVVQRILPTVEAFLKDRGSQTKQP
jgi:acyl-CoA thioesterase-1